MRSKLFHIMMIGLVLVLLLSSITPVSAASANSRAARQNAGDEDKRDDAKIGPDIVRKIDREGKSGPGTQVPVIVAFKPNGPGKSINGARAASLMAAGGGRGQRSLGLINGVAGTMPLAAIRALSRNPEVEFIAYDSPVGAQGVFSGDMVDYAALVNAPAVWALGYTGAGVGVAVIDSGVRENPAAGLDPSRVVATVDLAAGVDPQLVVATVNAASSAADDPGGHGTHIAGIIAGKGTEWSGVAPDANIIDIRVLGENGGASLSTVIAGIQWAVNNRTQYNIRIINLSLGGLPSVSYLNDPLSAAAEMAWHAGLVVVAAAGNGGQPGTIHTPGQDPYVVTVGALDPSGTLGRADDVVAYYSSQGPTLAGQTKPDVVAPGRKVVSLRAPGSYLDVLLPDRVVALDYFRLSGSSQATAVVSGLAALLIQKNPSLRPDEVKYLLKQSALPIAGYTANVQGAGSIDAYRAATYPEKRKDNRGLRPSNGYASRSFAFADKTVPLTWKDLNAHNGVDSKGVTWDSVTWDNVTWDSVTWDNIFWDGVMWDGVMWDGVTWDGVFWDSANWDSVGWDAFTID